VEEKYDLQMQDKATHIEVARAAGAGAVEARLLTPCCESLAFPNLLPSLFSSLPSHKCEFGQLGRVGRLTRICWGIQWSVVNYDRIL